MEFGADRDEIWFAGEAAKLPVVNADRYLNKLVIGYCEEAVSRRKARSGVIQADVENAIAALLPHGATRIENVAQKLRVESANAAAQACGRRRDLRRLEDLRFALAKHYLAEQDFRISRIAWLLGYTEVSAFSHAFRRWTGRTPRADRSRRRRPAAAGASGRSARPPLAGPAKSRPLASRRKFLSPRSQVFAGWLYYVTLCDNAHESRTARHQSTRMIMETIKYSARPRADMHAAGSHLPAPRDIARARGSRGRLDRQGSRAGARIRRIAADRPTAFATPTSAT